MRILRLIAALAITAAMTACVPSLHPLYGEDDSLFNSSLLGGWVYDDGDGQKALWTFTQSGHKNYRLVTREDDKSATFDVHLLKIGERLYLDIRPVEGTGDTDLYNALSIRSHTFLSVVVERATLSVALMDQDWLKDHLGSGGLVLDHHRLDDGNVLLTASTQDLQEFILRHGNDKGLFGEPAEFIRVAAD